MCNCWQDVDRMVSMQQEPAEATTVGCGGQAFLMDRHQSRPVCLFCFICLFVCLFVCVFVCLFFAAEARVSSGGQSFLTDTSLSCPTVWRGGGGKVLQSMRKVLQRATKWKVLKKVWGRAKAKASNCVGCCPSQPISVLGRRQGQGELWVQFTIISRKN